MPKTSRKANNIIPLYYQLQPAVNTIVSKDMERKIIILLTLILIGIGLASCAKPKVNTVPTEMDTIGKLDAISTVLGCMFDPTPCQAKKDLAKTEDK